MPTPGVGHLQVALERRIFLTMIDPLSPKFRLILASLTAPVVGIAVMVGLMSLTTVVGGRFTISEAVAGTRYALFYFLLFGLPVAYLVEAVVGIPAYRWLKRWDRLCLLPVTAVATTVGFLGVGWWGCGSASDLFLTCVLGIAMGAACGVSFWLVAFCGAKPTVLEESGGLQ